MQSGEGRRKLLLGRFLHCVSMRSRLCRMRVRVLAGKVKMSRRTSTRASFGGLVSVALPPPGRLSREPEQENRRDVKGKASAIPKAQASGILKAQASAVSKTQAAVPQAQPNGGARKSAISKPPQPKRSIAPSRPSTKPTEPQPRPSQVLKRASSQFGTGSGRFTMGGAAALDRRGYARSCGFLPRITCAAIQCMLDLWSARPFPLVRQMWLSFLQELCTACNTHVHKGAQLYGV